MASDGNGKDGHWLGWETVEFTKRADTVKAIELKNATDMKVGVAKEVQLIFTNILPRGLTNFKLIASGDDFGLDKEIIKS